MYLHSECAATSLFVDVHAHPAPAIKFKGGGVIALYRGENGLLFGEKKYPRAGPHHVVYALLIFLLKKPFH